MFLRAGSCLQYRVEKKFLGCVSLHILYNDPMNAEKQNFLIPPAIIIAGALIAAGIYFSGGAKVGGQNPIAGPDPRELAKNVAPVSNTDHVQGSAQAQVTIIEFSDLECPFCKSFHQTMRQVMDEYGADGRVRWVYRHFPLVGLHQKASKEAEAAECAGELGGNEVFWKYITKIFEVTPSNDGLDPAELPKIAAGLGLDKQKFEACLASGRHAALVEAQAQDAQNAGGTGTPFSVIITAKGEYIPLNGAYGLPEMKVYLDKALE